MIKAYETAQRAACFVVGEVRDRAKLHRLRWRYRPRSAMRACAVNEAILITCVGSLPIQAGERIQ